ncbi:protein-glutamate methylesterase/protein-glutamine glutaminase [Sinisalibacter aestuarii]|uniref:Protein-glutamate methylesterase/protein-glutamine glutaminase n=1 Tax=Sinisalibacter aestuarii TaxID=2949426 RepID=A0ABQ5LRS7_9RHOB|nr:chemotaxis response regulator protein-glutamate methylesterase [Sinisalibacter aestuarii]GKY87702.1 chemotaxis response regulator protein-glutamate methylesterase of group 1 operon [Sinisalibacter aestuarii]
MGRILRPQPAAGPVRVLIVDDSATMRQLIRAGLATDPRIRVIGEAGSARAARDAVKALTPDVMTLDVEMPGMDGIEFLDRLMRARPMPVVMFSSLTAEGSRAALRALSLGAVECLEKPRFAEAGETFARLADTLVAAAAARVGGAGRGQAPATAALHPGWRWNGKWVLIGASTGGVEALEAVLRSYPENGPPTLITQHMPAAFLVSFAARLDSTLRPRVRLAAEGDRPRQGEIYIAPGDAHLTLNADGETLHLTTGPKRSGHRPSVDEMFAAFRPLAERIVAVILTGMGRDGAAEMKRLRDAGATCIGQDEASAVVFGMPRVAQELGAVETVLPLDAIAGEILRRTARA